MNCVENASCSLKVIKVSQKDLPLSCPMPGMSLWNAHPKIYLPIAEEPQQQCPYCGTRYVLEEDDV